MYHHWLIAALVIIGASIAAMSGWILTRLMFNEDDAHLIDILMSAVVTFSLDFSLGCFGYNHFGLIGEAAGFFLGIVPGYYLVRLLAACMPDEENNKPRSKRDRSSHSEDFGWKASMAFISACIAAALTGGIAVKVGLPEAITVAVLGAPFVAVWTIGAVIGSITILLILFDGGMARLGKALDRQADRIWAKLRKNRAQ